MTSQKNLFNSTQPGLILSAAVILSSCNAIDDFLNVKPGDNTTGRTETDIIKFVAMGDTGHGNEAQYQVATAVKNKCAQDGCDFVLLLGDNIYNIGVDSVDDFQFDTKSELPYQDINLPFYLVLEIMITVAPIRELDMNSRNLFTRFSTPKSLKNGICSVIIINSPKAIALSSRWIPMLNCMGWIMSKGRICHSG